MKKGTGCVIALGLKKLEFPNVNFSDAKRFTQAALGAVKDGKLGDAVFGAVKPCCDCLPCPHNEREFRGVLIRASGGRSVRLSGTR